MKSIKYLRALLLLVLIPVSICGCSDGGTDMNYPPTETIYTSLDYALRDSLDVVHLELTGIDSLSPDIAKLKNLNYLEIKDSRMRFLPESIIELQNLEIFVISNCPLASIPPQINNIQSLYILVLKACGVESITGNFNREGKIYGINLSNNNLTEFDASVVDLSETNSLVLDGNQLVDVNISLKLAPALRHLFIKNNPLPDSVRARLKVEFANIDLQM